MRNLMRRGKAEPAPLKADDGNVPAKPDAGRDTPVHPADCEHSWGSLHVPDHRLYWVRQCSLCHAVDWDDLDAEIGKLLAGKDEIDERKDVIVADLRKAITEAERIIAERDAEIVRKNGRCDGLFATARRKDEQIEELGQEARTSEALIETLRGELAEAGVANGRLRAQGQRQAVTIGDLRRENAELRAALASPPTAEPILDLAYLEDLTARAAAMKAALERFAAPGAITATDRRKAASDALGAAQGDTEATP